MPRTQYTYETVMAAINDALAGHLTRAEICQKHHLSSPQLLSRWLKKYKEQGQEGIASSYPKAATQTVATAHPARAQSSRKTHDSLDDDTLIDSDWDEDFEELSDLDFIPKGSCKF